MARGADLFVVCKNCGSEVSPYVTECPYCGQRVRKRAPKIERGGGGPTVEPPKPPRASRRRDRGSGSARLRSLSKPSAGLREGRPYATIALVGASLLAYLVAVAGAYSVLDAIVFGKLDGEWWRIVTANFVHLSGGSLVFALGAYQFATMIAIGIFGTLLERRHGPVVVLLVALLAGAGGMLAAAAIESVPLAAGANGMALGLLAAWAVPDVLAWRRDREWEGDLLGTAVIAAVLLLMPAVVEVANAIVGVTGLLAGLLLGLVLARARRTA
ncbi:MAG TPA: rhomboid family intramembrane serine protease [Capillimicrobium sp.]|jgi:membrane associated rhomboid family serine protease